MSKKDRLRKEIMAAREMSNASEVMNTLLRDFPYGV